jgi:hypothetical protein
VTGSPSTPAAPVAGPIEAEAIRVRGTLAEPDYTDVFEVGTELGSRSAEQWARASFEGAPRAVRWFLLVGWRLVLGLRLGPRRSPDHVLGWTIVRRTREQIILETQSTLLGQVQLVFRVQASRVLAGTLIHFAGHGARAIWSIVGLVHRRTLPYLLTRGARR